jgi:hypothetical protein
MRISARTRAIASAPSGNDERIESAILHPQRAPDKQNSRKVSDRGSASR